MIDLFCPSQPQYTLTLDNATTVSVTAEDSAAYALSVGELNQVTATISMGPLSDELISINSVTAQAITFAANVDGTFPDLPRAE